MRACRWRGAARFQAGSPARGAGARRRSTPAAGRQTARCAVVTRRPAAAASWLPSRPPRRPPRPWRRWAAARARCPGPPPSRHRPGASAAPRCRPPCSAGVAAARPGRLPATRRWLVKWPPAGCGSRVQCRPTHGPWRPAFPAAAGPVRCARPPAAAPPAARRQRARRHRVAAPAMFPASGAPACEPCARGRGPAAKPPRARPRASPRRPWHAPRPGTGRPRRVGLSSETELAG